jgi:hypothetical protein
VADETQTSQTPLQLYKTANRIVADVLAAPYALRPRMLRELRDKGDRVVYLLVTQELRRLAG